MYVVVCIYVFVLYFSRQGRRRNVQTLGKMTATGAITNTSTISQLTRQDGASRNLTITKIQLQEEFNNKLSFITSCYCAVLKISKFNLFLSESMFLLILSLFFSPHLSTASLSPRSKELATKWAPRFALYL